MLGPPGVMWWLLLLRSPGTWLHRLQHPWSTGLAAPWHVEYFWTRDWTLVPCTGRWTLNRWTTREVPLFPFYSQTCQFIFHSYLNYILIFLTLCCSFSNMSWILCQLMITTLHLCKPVNFFQLPQCILQVPHVFSVLLQTILNFHYFLFNQWVTSKCVLVVFKYKDLCSFSYMPISSQSKLHHRWVQFLHGI